MSAIQAVKGIGAKTAQRIIIDLKDKVAKGIPTSDLLFDKADNTIKEEALSALEVLGINKRSSERLVDKIVLESPDISVESIIKETLKNL